MLDGAGARPRPVGIPEGIELEPLPAYSPELQPPPDAARIRRPWPLTNEAVANAPFAGLGELEDADAHDPELIRSHTLYHW